MVKFIIIAALASSFALTACESYTDNKTENAVISETASSEVKGTEDGSVRLEVGDTEKNNDEQNKGMLIMIGNKRFTVELENNATVEALQKEMSLTLEMSELNGNEKYCYLDEPLPHVPENIGHINKGDIMLFGDNCMVIFYKSFDTPYSYTRVGHIDDTSELTETLGAGDVRVKFELE